MDHPRNQLSWLISAAVTMLLANLAVLPVACAEVVENNAYSERFMFRYSVYSVRYADTDIAVFSEFGLGAGFSFSDDLGGDSDLTIPRIDGYYRIDGRHRIEFSTLKIERDGRKRLEIDIDIGDENYNIGETVVSSIDYELFKLAYAFSFYRSPEVELSISGGLNQTSYDFAYERADGSSADSSDVSSPLPMLGFQVSYLINPRWSVRYLSEIFYVNLGDELEGSFQNHELNLQYRVSNHFMFGTGLTRFSTDLESRDSDWNGRISDTHLGVLIFVSYIN